MLTRREFLKSAAVFSAVLFVPQGSRNWVKLLAATNPSLDPTTITKYANALAIPPAMPRVSEITGKAGELIDYYEISMRQFSQQILPSGFPATTVWSYGNDAVPASFFYPSNTIEATVNKPVRVKWINGLTDAQGNYLPHLLAVDPTLHWANPPGPRDEIPTFSATPTPYTGPVPMVTHLHGGHTFEESDGFPSAWFLPDAKNIPSGYFKVGSFYDENATKFADKYGQAWTPGSAIFQYPNDQRAGTLWYHDHTLGMTRLNVYAGPAGFYVIRGGPDDLSAGVLPSKPYEIPVLIQDRSFNADGSLFYPDSREFFDGFTGPFTPDSDMAPLWNPETFGNAIVVNGRAWPHFKVEPRRYRLRLLNGCNARTLILKIASDPRATRPASAALPFWQIGTEGGFLEASVQQDHLLIAPAERVDVVLDFTGLPQGTKLYLINEGPDAPFGGGIPNTDFPAADPNTTGQVMKFEVGTLASLDTSLPVDQINFPKIAPLVPASITRQVSMNELDSDELSGIGPRIGQLGMVNKDGTGAPMRWMDAPSEVITLGSTEVWEIYNFTEDAHPLHLHLVMFRLINREDMQTHAVTQPEPGERGFKDTILVYPGTITRVQATYDRAGQYVWHCHILEHEDNEMMRPMQVVSSSISDGIKIFIPVVQNK